MKQKIEKNNRLKIGSDNNIKTMTKVIPYFITVVVLLTATRTTFAIDTKQMTMTTKKSGEVVIYMAGSGTVTIDWGDKTEVETYTLSPSTWADSITSSHTYSHTYSRTLNCRRVITIFGEGITHLICEGNQLTHLDVSKNTSLASLSCSNNKLTKLDLSNNAMLTNLYCYENQLSNIDVSQSTLLTSFDCRDNKIKSLNVSNNISLKHFNCSNNKLTNLDVSNNAVLSSLLCTMNKLTELDVSNNTVLINLICVNNRLTRLDVSKNIGLAWLYCGSNKLTTEALNDLFGTLHSNIYLGVNNIYIDDNPGTNHCDRSIATNKGWWFKSDLK